MKKCSVCKDVFVSLGVDDRCEGCLYKREDKIIITKYYYLDDDGTTKVYDTDTIREEFEEEMERLQ